MFRKKYPAAWTFHRNSSFNKIDPATHPDDKFTQYFKEYPGCATTLLPKIRIPKAYFAPLLLKRHSCRNFSDTPLSLHSMANILFAGYGVKNSSALDYKEYFERTVPSGGATYSLELYLIARSVKGLTPGIYHYLIQPTLLEHLKTLEINDSLFEKMFGNDHSVANAGAIVIATSVVDRTMNRYAERGYRFILLEAGHAFQNMNLMSSVCGLGSLNIGGFFDMAVAEILEIDIEQEIPLYAMAIGKAEPVIHSSG